MLTVLDQQAWRTREVAHHTRVDGWLHGYRQRRRTGTAHPVEDFLFTYYSYRPARLRRWHPGVDVVLDGADPAGFGPHHILDPGGRVRVDVEAVLAKRRDAIEWIYQLQRAVASRPAHLGCFNMHEWAMVYRLSPEQVRHNALNLRIGAEATAAVVEEVKVRCSHFDAFRFFTPAARPRNALQPTRATQIDDDQPGCLHANMDVYRWAYKLVPLVSADLVADCYHLAREIRMVDMRASPYDLTGFGLEPLAVETPDGRIEYARHQRHFADLAAVLRDRLIDACATVLARSAHLT